MATIEDRSKSEPDKNWNRPYRVRWQDPATGKRKSESYRLKKDAERRHREVENLEDRGIVAPTVQELREHTVARVVDAFLAAPRSVRNEGYDLQDSTLAGGMKAHLRRIREDFGPRPIIDLVNDRAAILRFKETLRGEGKADGTVNRYLSAMSSLLRYAQQSGHLPNGTVLPRMPWSRETARIAQTDRLPSFSPAQMVAIAEAAPESLRVLYLTAAHTGARQAELVALRLQDLDLESDMPTASINHAATRDYSGFKPTKAYEGTERRVPIGLPSFVTALREHIAATAELRAQQPDLNLLFPNRDGRMYHGSSVGGKTWRAACREVGIADAYTFQHMRRSYGSVMLAEVKDVVTVSRLLGHSSIQTTLKSYATELPGRAAEVNAALRRAFGGEDV